MGVPPTILKERHTQTHHVKGSSKKRPTILGVPLRNGTLKPTTQTHHFVGFSKKRPPILKERHTQTHHFGGTPTILGVPLRNGTLKPTTQTHHFGGSSKKRHTRLQERHTQTHHFRGSSKLIRCRMLSNHEPCLAQTLPEPTRVRCGLKLSLGARWGAIGARGKVRELQPLKGRALRRSSLNPRSRRSPLRRSSLSPRPRRSPLRRSSLSPRSRRSPP